MFSLFILASFCLPLAHCSSTKSCPGSAIEGLTQAGYKAAWTIDSKNYTAFNEVFTQDIHYDSSALGAYGGITDGIENTTAAIQAAGMDAKVQHLVTNLYVKEMLDANTARVIT